MTRNRKKRSGCRVDAVGEGNWIDGRGKYYPRVFFLNPDKSIDYDINNAGFSPMYHHYYYDATTLQDNMLRYLENHGMYERDMTDISDIDNDYEMEL